VSETLRFETTRFGELEVAADAVITVRGGLIGFPKFERFVILEHNPPFSWLQSVTSPSLAFVIVNGGEFGDNYEVVIPTNDPDFNGPDVGELAIVNLVSIRGDAGDATVNLKAPIIVNSQTRFGRQVVLDDARYSTRFPLWDPGTAEG